MELRYLGVILILLFNMTACKTRTEVINAGIGGNTSGDLLKRVDIDIISEKPDLVIIMVGTNDMVNSGKLIEYGTYRKNLRALVDILQDNKIDNVLLSPPPVDSAYLFTRHNRDLYKELPNVKLDSASNIVSKVAEESNTHFIDLNAEFVKLDIPLHNEDDIIRNINNCGVSDGVHPTEKGYQMIAEIVFNYLEDSNILSPGMKIICFGDSITKGVHMKGQGTSQGDTYPAVLSRLINNTETASALNNN